MQVVISNYYMYGSSIVSSTGLLSNIRFCVSELATADHPVTGDLSETTVSLSIRR